MADVETRKRVWTLKELKRAHGGDIAMAEMGGRPVSRWGNELKFSTRLDIEIGTTQPKKIDEFNAPLAISNKNIRLTSAVRSLGWWLCDPEESGTYVGNAAGKALALIDRIYNHHTFGYDSLVSDMKGRGTDPSSLLYVVNDTGYSFLRDYRTQEEFLKSAHKAGPVGWPGPELGPIMDAHTGVAGFYSDLKRMAHRRKEVGEEQDVLLKGFDEVTYMFFRPMKNPDDIRVYSFEARVPVTFHLDPPEGYNGEVLTGYHFMSMRAQNAPAHLRESRISEIKDEYLTYHSPMAHALRDFFETITVPASYQRTFHRAAVDPARVFRLSTQNNMMDASVVKDTDVPFSLPRGLRPSNLRYDHGAINSLHEMTKGSDAVVLQAHRPGVTANWREHFLPMLDIYSSLVVKRQVEVETMSGRPLVILQRKDNKFYQDGFSKGELNWDDPKTERAFLRYLDTIDPAQDPWLTPMMLTRYLHEKNAVKQEEHHLFTHMEPDDPDVADTIVTKIFEGLSQRIDPPDYKRETFGMDRRDKFEVFIGGSAGTHAEDYINAAEDLGYWCAQQGFHVRTGGGNYGVMGAVARGVLRFMDEHPDRANDTHLSLIQTFRTIQFEGAAIDPREIEFRSNVHMAIEETFDARMASLFRVKGEDAQDASIGTANVIMFGGIGTVQEATRWMRYKESGVPHMQDQKMIFFNQHQAGDVTGRQIRALDAFMRVYPPDIRREHINAQPDLESVKMAILEQHRGWLFNADLTKESAPRTAASSSLQL